MHRERAALREWKSTQDQSIQCAGGPERQSMMMASSASISYLGLLTQGLLFFLFSRERHIAWSHSGVGQLARDNFAGRKHLKSCAWFRCAATHVAVSQSPANFFFKEAFCDPE